MKPESIVPILPPNSTPAPEALPPAPDYQDYDTYDSDYSRPDYNDYNYNSGNEPSPVNSNDYSNDYNYDYNSIDQGNFKFGTGILMEFSLEFLKNSAAVCKIRAEIKKIKKNYHNRPLIHLPSYQLCRRQQNSWQMNS